MALALLLATAGREELSAPKTVPCPPGTVVARDAAVEGSGGTVPIRLRAERETRFTMLCLELSKTSFCLSFSLLPLFFSLRLDSTFILCTFRPCMLARHAFFLLSLNAYLMATI